MKKICLLSALMLVVLVSKNIKAQKTYEQPSQIVIGSVESIYSEVLSEEREILIYVPESASDEVYTPEKYAVIYLTDGDDIHFSEVVSMVRHLSSIFECPEMMVVGIPNIDRNRDLTPTGYNIPEVITAEGDNFMSFIEEELIPNIDANYPTLPYRVIVGHSLGGLMVVHTLVNHPDIFNAYIAIDPAVGEDNRKIINESKEIILNGDFSGKTLFLGINHPFGEGMDTMTAENDLMGWNEYAYAIHAYKDLLESNPQNNLDFGYKIYNNYSHNSVRIITELDAIRFIFNYFTFLVNDIGDFRNLIENAYNNYSKQAGFEIKPPERTVDNSARQFLQRQLYDIAFYYLNLNVTNYPESYNVYNSLGDYYVAIGDKENAMNSYKKSLSIKEVESVRKKLEDLQEE